MATSLAAMTARRAANLARLSIYNPSANQASFPIPRRGLAGSADHHGPPKIDCWKDPMNPSQWKEEHLVIVSVAVWGLLITGAYKFFTRGKKETDEVLKFFTRGKKETDEKLVEAAH